MNLHFGVESEFLPSFIRFSLSIRAGSFHFHCPIAARPLICTSLFHFTLFFSKFAQ